MPFEKESYLFTRIFESKFISDFVESLRYKTYAYIEPVGFFGIPDLVIVNLPRSNSKLSIIRSFAFEMKLSNWKRAIIQAYKYRAFVNLSFVVLDQTYIKPALINIDQFISSNIGLISVDDNVRIKVLYYPNKTEPYSIPLQNKLEEMVLKKDSLNINKYKQFVNSNNRLLTGTSVLI